MCPLCDWNYSFVLEPASWYYPCWGDKCQLRMIFLFFKRNRGNCHLKLFIYLLKYEERGRNQWFRHSYQKTTLSPSISLFGGKVSKLGSQLTTDTGKHLLLFLGSFCLYLVSYEMLKHFSSLLLSRDFPNITFLSQRFYLHWASVCHPGARGEEPDFLCNCFPASLPCSGSRWAKHASFLAPFPRSLSLENWIELFLFGRAP